MSFSSILLDFLHGYSIVKDKRIRPWNNSWVWGMVSWRAKRGSRAFANKLDVFSFSNRSKIGKKPGGYMGGYGRYLYIDPFLENLFRKQNQPRQDCKSSHWHFCQGQIWHFSGTISVRFDLYSFSATPVFGGGFRRARRRYLYIDRFLENAFDSLGA